MFKTLKDMKPDVFSKCVLFTIFCISAIAYFVTTTVMIFVYFTSKTYGEVGMGIDFNAYMTGAFVLKDSPKLLFDGEIQTKYQKTLIKGLNEGLLSYRNTPIVALLYRPYTYLKIVEAYKVNYIVQTFFVLIFIFYLYKLSKVSLLFLPISLFFLPIICQPMYGQISIIVALALAAIYNLFRSGKYFLAGLVSSLLMLKFQYLIAIPYLFIFSKDKKRFALGTVLSSALLITIDSLIYRSFYLPDYLRFLIKSENNNFGTDNLALYNISAFARMIKLPDQTGFILSVIFLVVTLVVTYILRNKVSLETFFVSLVLWILSITIHSNLVDLIFLLIPIALLIKMEGRTQKFFAVILFFFPVTSNLRLQGIVGLILLIMGFLILLTKRSKVIQAHS